MILLTRCVADGTAKVASPPVRVEAIPSQVSPLGSWVALTEKAMVLPALSSAESLNETAKKKVSDS